LICCDFKQVENKELLALVQQNCQKPVMSQRQLFLTLKTETPPLWDVLGTAGYLQKSHCHGENRNLVICDIHIFSSPKEARKSIWSTYNASGNGKTHLQFLWDHSPVSWSKPREGWPVSTCAGSECILPWWLRSGLKKNPKLFIPYLLEECSVYRQGGPEPNPSAASWIPKSSRAMWDYTTGKIKLMQILGLAGCEARK